MTTYQDITLDKIDFDWIAQCNKVSYLKKAIRVIEEDGDYYKQLKDACLKRMEDIDPSLKKKVFDNAASQELKRQLEKELGDWEEQVSRDSKPKQTTEQIQPESYFEKIQKMTPEQKKKLAENERNKGNESIKSKDFDQAISYYNKSIEYDPTMAASYCNRALAYLKKKQFQKTIEDCDKALELNPSYTKAHHRKAKAYQGQKNNVKAYLSFKQALKLEPQNREVNGELKELRESLTAEQLESVDRPSALVDKAQFKRIVIEEEDQEAN